VNVATGAEVVEVVEIVEVADAVAAEALGVTPAASQSCVPNFAATRSRITVSLTLSEKGGRCNLRAASVALQEVPTQAPYDSIKVGERQMQVVFVTGQPLPPMAFAAQVTCIQSHLVELMKS
jgi:hypothetical protein